MSVENLAIISSPRRGGRAGGGARGPREIRLTFVCGMKPPPSLLPISVTIRTGGRHSHAITLARGLTTKVRTRLVLNGFATTCLVRARSYSRLPLPNVQPGPGGVQRPIHSAPKWGDEVSGKGILLTGRY
jgi:hypothetical protein